MKNDQPENMGGHESPGWKPVLGLSDEPPAPLEFAARPGTVFDQPEPEPLLELTVIVPARNEEDCIGACLESLVGQSEEIFQLGRDWELIVVDDDSTDRTAEIARSFTGVTVVRRRGWRRVGRARGMLFGRRRARPGASGCCSQTPIRFTSPETCTAPSTKPRGTRREC